MRLALWLLALFAVAVAVALGLSQHVGTVTVFVPPHRIDLSLNLVVIGLVVLFALVYVAMRGLLGLWVLPGQARRWRVLQRERSAQSLMLQAQMGWMTGRYLRARKAALQGLAHVEALLTSQEGGSPTASLLLMRSVLHLLAAESAHVLRDEKARNEHLQQVFQVHPALSSSLRNEVQDAARLNATRWALHDRDERSAHQYLSQLPQGTARRTLALRLRLKADRMGQMHLPALDTARLLAKHGAFSANAANSLMRSLALASIDDCRDAHQLQATWRILQSAEKAMPEVAVHAARRLLDFGGEAKLALQWLLPVWDALVSDASAWSDSTLRQRVVAVLAQALQTLPPDSEWLARVEQSRLANPRSVELQYLSGMVCLRHSLWGKAQQQLEQAAPRLLSSELKRSAWKALAELAEQKGDTAQALACWKLAANA
jgi:HemY protein